MLGLVGDADAMHSILDVETTGTMVWLDSWFQTRGGRRGRAQTRTATGGLTYAVTRHATSRAGDPSPHDHVLVANVIEMLDNRSGWKALDSAALRDTVEAATMVGRLRSAWRAVELTYVALSRARDRTTLHATADDLSQAVDDLHADWGVEHHQQWVSQTSASLGVHPEPQRRSDEPTAPAATLEGVRIRIAALERDYQDLQTGLGRWQYTPEGQAARRLHRARSRLADALHRSSSPDTRRRERRAAQNALGDLQATLTATDREWQAIGEPVAEELSSVITGELRRLRHDTAQQHDAGSLLPAIASDISD